MVHCFLVDSSDFLKTSIICSSNASVTLRVRYWRWSKANQLPSELGGKLTPKSPLRNGKKEMFLAISVQEVMDQSGYHLNYRIVEFCSTKNMNVHCRWNPEPVVPRDQTKDLAEAEQKMPKVLKTAAREEDKVESSQTKIKEVKQPLQCFPVICSAAERQDLKGKFETFVNGQAFWI